MSFENLNLNADIKKALTACGFDSPTEIQREAIPLVLDGRDLMASAQTGTGKTAAFVLPALELLTRWPRKPGVGPRVLVLTPTRELATQVTDNIKLFSRFSRVFSGSLVGGVPYPPQISMLSKPQDIIVATPGRLKDHMERGRIDFSRIEMLILDEADRMLDMGFVDEVREIAAAMPAERQTLLFSATLEGRIDHIARSLLKDPARIQQVATQARHASITQHIHQADDLAHKHRLLSYFLKKDELDQAVIFTATKQGADMLAQDLADQGHQVAALHGDMSQHVRRRTVENMRRGKHRVLVATDVAARGLDIKGISHVINFDLPMVAEDYIHRIGRTGRGGATGIAISLVGPQDWGKLRGIEKLTGSKLQREIVPGLEPVMPEPSSFRSSGKPRGKGGRNFRGNGNNNGGGWKGRSNASGQRRTSSSHSGSMRKDA